MENTTNNPENLHMVAKDLTQVNSMFVSPGTPTAPLVTEAQINNPEVSKSATSALRAGMIKTNGVTE